MSDSLPAFIRSHAHRTTRRDEVLACLAGVIFVAVSLPTNAFSLPLTLIGATFVGVMVWVECLASKVYST